MTAEDGARAVGWLAELDLILGAAGPRLGRVWELRDRMSAHDASYAATAEALEVPLVGADQQLVDTAGRTGIEAVHLDRWTSDGRLATDP